MLHSLDKLDELQLSVARWREKQPSRIKFQKSGLLQLPKSLQEKKTNSAQSLLFSIRDWSICLLDLFLPYFLKQLSLGLIIELGLGLYFSWNDTLLPYKGKKRKVINILNKQYLSFAKNTVFFNLIIV